jgi:wyosine [tRNA(Phe)-imidazoG37] synthetase (radical SAM superfamily)
VKRLFSEDDYNLGDYVCEVPFKQLDILEQSSHLCCASWLHKSVGNLGFDSHEEVWNSDAAEAIRHSILDGSYRYCNKTACQKLPGKQLTPKSALMNDPWWSNVISNHLGKLDRAPERVNLSYDKHCNLSCPSCRTELITSDDEARNRLDRITQKNVFPLLTNAKLAFVTGSGDPFASRTFRKVLAWISPETCPDLEVIVMTNGMLLNEKEWAKFPNLPGRVKLVSVSVDGATKETHELLRRGSKWEVMSKNLPFIGSLLARGDIKRFQIVMVVQRENFEEMGAFVDLGKAVGASRVYFETITNWGTFSDEEYAAKAVHNPTHPQHADFQRVMHDPRLRDPIVAWGSLAEMLPPVVSEAA